MPNYKKYFIEQTKNRVKFGPVDTSYMHVIERWTPAGADKSFYSCWLLIPKTAADVLQAINNAIETAIQDGLAKKWNNKKPKDLALPLRDGDEEEDPEFHGHYILNAKAKEHRPGLGVIRNGVIVADEFAEADNWYSGNKVIASISFFPYKASGNSGVGCGLDNLVQVEKGERKAGSPAFTKDFANIDLSGLGLGADADDDDL